MKEKTKKIISIIFFIVCGILFVLGLFLTRPIYPRCSETEPIDMSEAVKNEITTVFAEDNNLVIYPPSRMLKIEQGADNFGIAVGFAPNNSQAWGVNNEGCRYSIEAVENNCINHEWLNIESVIITGTKNVIFDEINNDVGYSRIKLDIPKNAPLCVQRFRITVNCSGYPAETTSSFFDVQILKKKLFC